MPDIDEDILRELLHRSTEDLHAPSAVTTHIMSHNRRRRVRGRVLSVAATGAAAGLVAGVVAASTGGRHPASAGSTATAGSQIRLTAAQQTLYDLSKASAATPRQAGRYVVMREEATGNGNGRMQSSETISVIDTLTGGIVTYQDWAKEPRTAKPPTELTSPPGSSPTQAQYNAMPTNPAALRKLLLTQAEKQQQTQLAHLPAGKKHIHVPRETSDDLVFQQATDLLWSPMLSPALRAAVYKVLAATPGVVVKTGVHDSAGQPTVEISRFDAVGDTNYVTFEDPSTGGTLETLATVPYNAASHTGGGYYRDLYQSITYTNTIPANPYRG
jgi:hypothetical protein